MKAGDSPKQEAIANPRLRIGFMKGLYKLPEDFEEIDKKLDKEIEKLFYGRELEPQEEKSGGGPKELGKS